MLFYRFYIFILHSFTQQRKIRIMEENLLIINIAWLGQTYDEAPPIQKGFMMNHLPFIENAWLLIKEGKIDSFGKMEDCPEIDFPILNAENGHVLPCWCDSHTHIVFPTYRENEFRMKIEGKTYEEIAAAGGGILNTANKMTAAEPEDLFQSAKSRAEEMISNGTGAIEIKSGYGLSVGNELKMLRVIQRLKEELPIPVKATFLGAHAIPTKYKEDRMSYIRTITDVMLPMIYAQNLADYCDVFCDEGFFTPEETSFILKAAAKMKLKPKIHANELAVSGGVQVGIKHNALTVDHLERITDVEVECLKNSDTIPTLLPGTSFFLSIPYAPARQLITAGVPIALASDFNPGSCPSGNIPLLISIACTQMKITPEEAINALTINGSYAMEVNEIAGSITPGKLGNVIITKPLPSLTFFPYSFGSELIKKVIIKGKPQEN
jgi:imidazolonepropionase